MKKQQKKTITRHIQLTMNKSEDEMNKITEYLKDAFKDEVFTEVNSIGLQARIKGRLE